MSRLSFAPPAAAVLWRGQPVVQRATLAERVVTLTCAVIAAVSFGFAIVVSRGLEQSPTSLLLTSACLASVALLVWRVPPAWRAALRYEITERHVIARRGPLWRMMERQSLSYARICWHERAPHLGDLELIRAVPTGALRRTLALRLSNLEAPDRVLALLRGVEASPSMGNASVPLAQRLDEGERVLWTARPLEARWNRRRLLTTAIAAGLVSLVIVTATRLSGLVLAVHQALTDSVFWVFVTSLLLAWALVLAFGLAMAYVAVVLPARRLRDTRYFVTNRRVLIRRGAEELSLDRARIAYVIADDRRSSRDLFLVLDGPRARAMAVHGAFGAASEATELSPVLAAIGPIDEPELLLSAPVSVV